MRVATLNILHGRSPADGTVAAERLRDSIADLDADVLGLQEVDRGQPRSGRLDLAAVAASAYDGRPGGVRYRYLPTLAGTPGRGWRPLTDASDDGGADPPPGPTYGIALLTRYPVVRWSTLRLPTAPSRLPVVTARGLRWKRDEPRAVLAAVVVTPYGPMTVATTHLSYLPGWNAVQLRRALAHLDALPAPRLLLGDLNLPHPFPGVLSRWKVLADLPTYPAAAPRVQLDHVIGHGPLPPVAAAEARALPLSDHRALVVEF